MEKWILFFKIIALVIGAISTIVGLLTVYMSLIYEKSIQKTIDKLGGYTRVFRPIPFLVVALICWAFIIAFW